MGRGSKEIEELGYDILDAVRRGKLSGKDAQAIWRKSLGSASNFTVVKYRTGLRKALGVDDPIVKAFDGIIELGRRRKLSRSARIEMLRPDRPSPSQWADKDAEGQRRSWASGKRKPFPEDQGERISRGLQASRERRKRGR